jgi:hypothetical protein
VGCGVWGVGCGVWGVGCGVRGVGCGGLAPWLGVPPATGGGGLFALACWSFSDTSPPAALLAKSDAPSARKESGREKDARKSKRQRKMAHIGRARGRKAGI